jgi:hypothetical protein
VSYTFTEHRGQESQRASSESMRIKQRIVLKKEGYSYLCVTYLGYSETDFPKAVKSSLQPRR